MSGEMEKIQAAKEIATNPLLILFAVAVFLGGFVYMQHKERQSEVLRQEKVMDHLFERSNEVIEKNTKAFERSTDAFHDQKDVITELKSLIKVLEF